MNSYYPLYRKTSYIAPPDEAQLFIDAAGITDSTQQTAIIDLVAGLKTDGLWNKFYAIYPMVGGTASTHKWNLKDPRDLDVAFRLTFNGTVTHNSNGVTGNGSNGYANTYFNDSTVGITRSDFGLGVYSRTNTTGSRVGMGSVAASNYTWIAPRYNSTDDHCGMYSVVATNNVLSNSLGLITAQRASSSAYKVYQNGVLEDTQNTSETAYNYLNMYLMCRHLMGSPSNYSSDNYAFFYMAKSMTDAEQTSLYNRVQTYQTTLGRNV